MRASDFILPGDLSEKEIGIVHRELNGKRWREL